MCEYILLGCQVGIFYMVVYLNKVDQVDDEELLELVEMEVCELLFSYDYFGDDILIIKGLVLVVMESCDFEIGENLICVLIVVVDEYILMFECVVDQLFLLLIEDVFLILGCGMVVIGWIECGVVNVGDELEIVGICDIKKMICMGVEMFCKLLDCGEVGDNVGVLLCGIDCDGVECGQVLVKLKLVMLYMIFEVEVYILIKEEGGCYMLFFVNYCL